MGFVFGAMIDLNMYLTSALTEINMVEQVLLQFVGCSVLGFGVSMEVRCGSVTMPGEGLPVAISKASGVPFAKAKICIDVLLVITAVTLCYLYFGTWLWNVVGVGTLFAMLYVGAVVKGLDPYMKWFDDLMADKYGFRRVIYGLARYIRRN